MQLKRLCLLVALALPVPATVQAAPEPDFHTAWDLPDEPIGHRLGHILEAIRRADETFTRDLVQDAFAPPFRDMLPMAMHLEQFQAFHDMLGDRFTVDGIRIQGPLQADLILMATDRKRVQLHVELEEPEPHRVAGIGLQPHDGDTEIPEFTNLDQVHRYLDDLAQSGKFAGVVLVERRDQKPWFHAYGLANRETGVRNSAGTRFNVGSITKAFTSVAVMQLVEAGKIALDDPMGKHLTGFPPEIASKVTVRHLLKMESGYGDYFGSPIYQENRTRLRSIDDLLEILRTLELGFEPGTDNQYSNAGYAILGAIIEKVSGVSYYDYVETHVFRAAGMTGSSFPDYAGHDKHVAMGYTNDGDSGRRDYSEPYLDFFAPRGSPAGGSFSTAGDLVTFNRALRANRLLNEANTTLLLNFFNEGRPRPSRRGIAGGAPGVSAVDYEDADRGLTVIVLSNQDEPFGEQVGEAIFRMLAGS